LREEILGKRYAKALIKLCVEKGVLERVREDLTNIVSVFNGQELFRRVMCDPVYAAKERRKAILKDVMKRLEISDICQRFLYLLIEKERIRYVPAILEAYMRLEDEAAGRLRARIVSAYPLPGENVDKIRKALEERLHKQVFLELQIEKELIGGVICKVNGMVFDGSVRTQIETLKETLRRE
jgi:F-type H+-transporting ATPase subunit delta